MFVHLDMEAAKLKLQETYNKYKEALDKVTVPKGYEEVKPGCYLADHCSEYKTKLADAKSPLDEEFVKKLQIEYHACLVNITEYDRVVYDAKYNMATSQNMIDKINEASPTIKRIISDMDRLVLSNLPTTYYTNPSIDTKMTELIYDDKLLKVGMEEVRLRYPKAEFYQCYYGGRPETKHVEIYPLGNGPKNSCTRLV